MENMGEMTEMAEMVGIDLADMVGMDMADIAELAGMNMSQMTGIGMDTPQIDMAKMGGMDTGKMGESDIAKTGEMDMGKMGESDIAKTGKIDMGKMGESDIDKKEAMEISKFGGIDTPQMGARDTTTKEVMEISNLGGIDTAKMGEIYITTKEVMEISKSGEIDTAKMEETDITKKEVMEVPKMEETDITSKEVMEVSKLGEIDTAKMGETDITKKEVVEVPKLGESDISKKEVMEISKFGGTDTAKTTETDMTTKEVMEIPKMAEIETAKIDITQQKVMYTAKMEGKGISKMGGVGTSKMAGMGTSKMGGVGTSKIGGIGMPNMGRMDMSNTGGMDMSNTGGMDMPKMGGMDMANMGGMEMVNMVTMAGMDMSDMCIPEMAGMDMKNTAGMNMTDNGIAGMIMSDIGIPEMNMTDMMGISEMAGMDMAEVEEYLEEIKENLASEFTTTAENIVPEHVIRQQITPAQITPVQTTPQHITPVVQIQERRVTFVAPRPAPTPALRRSDSNVTLYYDFDTIAVLNVWIRHQKMNLRMFSVYGTFIFLLTMHVLEMSSSVMIIVGLVYIGKNRAPEIASTILMWLIINFAVIALKVGLQRNVSTPSFCTNQIGGFWNALLLLLKPAKYFRMLHHRNLKMAVLEKQFKHGETVTRDQFDYIMKINLTELVDAKDDLHDAYLKRLPMALVHFFFFYNSYQTSEKCNVVDGVRFMVVIINIMMALVMSFTFEWKQKIYMDSLHVQGYFVTQGRYKVPMWVGDHVSHFLSTLCRITFTLSRFFLIGFGNGMSLGFGLGVIVMLLFSNWIFIALFPSILNKVENLPIGVQTAVSFMIDRWINIFSTMSTRYNELTRYPIKIGPFERKIPLVFTQIVNFMASFLIIYCFIELAAASSPLPSTASGYLFSVNRTFDLSKCADYKLWPSFAVFGSSIIYSGLIYLSIMCQNPTFGPHAMLHFHWILFYTHIVLTLMYNFYWSKVFGEEGTREIFPPMLSLTVFKSIFKKAFKTRSYSKHINILARLLFLIGLDLKHFRQLHIAYGRNDGDVVTSTSWWDEQILHILEKYESNRVSARDMNPPALPNLSDLPIEKEITKACHTIQNLPYSYRLHMYCGHSLDGSLLTDITSHRLEATIEMLQLQRRSVTRIVEADIMGIVVSDKETDDEEEA